VLPINFLPRPHFSCFLSFCLLCFASFSLSPVSSDTGTCSYHSSSMPSLISSSFAVMSTLLLTRPFVLLLFEFYFCFISFTTFSLPLSHFIHIFPSVSLHSFLLQLHLLVLILLQQGIQRTNTGDYRPSSLTPQLLRSKQ
jgi:hypothetical protein